jgi:radical SAM protein with 4Fe4S-binding SPASM domain
MAEKVQLRIRKDGDIALPSISKDAKARAISESGVVQRAKRAETGRGSASKADELKNLASFVYNWKVRKSWRPTHAPLEVSVEVTNARNLGDGSGTPPSPQFLSQDEARFILDRIRQFGYEKSAIHWTLGGEPFAHEQFAELCEIGATEFGFTNQFFETNAVLLTADKARSLPQSVKFTFCINFCADKKFFADAVGSETAWDTIRSNIEAILADPTLRHMEFLLTDFSSSTTETPAALKRRMTALASLFPKSSRLHVRPKTLNDSSGILWSRGARSEERYQLCPYPWSSLFIAVNGDVLACGRDTEHKSVLGNVFEDTLQEIWHDDRFSRFRQYLAAEDPDMNETCRNCDMHQDAAKFTLENVAKTVQGRLQVFRSGH